MESDPGTALPEVWAYLTLGEARHLLTSLLEWERACRAILSGTSTSAGLARN